VCLFVSVLNINSVSQKLLTAKHVTQYFYFTISYSRVLRSMIHIYDIHIICWKDMYFSKRHVHFHQVNMFDIKIKTMGRTTLKSCLL